jgi:nitric oxide synthase oxygenase domain/subunit
MKLEAGGLQFPSSPFAGWYTSVEVLRDFIEPNRYNKLYVMHSRYLNPNKVFPMKQKIFQEIAKALNLETTNNTTLWKDEVALELNKAILYSFNKAGNLKFL